MAELVADLLHSFPGFSSAGFAMLFAKRPEDVQLTCQCVREEL
jgi:hypothetical protein